MKVIRIVRVSIIMLRVGRSTRNVYVQLTNICSSIFWGWWCFENSSNDRVSASESGLVYRIWTRVASVYISMRRHRIVCGSVRLNCCSTVKPTLPCISRAQDQGSEEERERCHGQFHAGLSTAICLEKVSKTGCVHHDARMVRTEVWEASPDPSHSVWENQ